LAISSEPRALRALTAPQVRATVGGNTVAIAGALAIEGLVSATAGAAACALLVAVLLNHHVATLGWEANAEGSFLVLGLVALAGLLAVAMPIEEVSPAGWPLLFAPPVLLATALAAKHLAVGRGELGLVLGARWPQARIALTGVPLGLLAYALVRPAPVAGGAAVAVAVAVAGLALLAATEEVLFRGLLQPRLVRLHGEAGVQWTAALSAAAALGTRSPAFALLAGLVAAALGREARRTGSIAGASAARALLFIGLLVVWPHVL
jgi:hypothetical protein